MALVTHTLEGPAVLAALARPEFDWSCGTSWDGSLLAIQRYLGDVERMLDGTTDPLARGFLALEFRSAVVELLEYAGGVVRAVRARPALSHGADSRALSEVFEAMKAGVSHAEAAAVLYLHAKAPTSGDSAVDVRLSNAYGRILGNAAMCLADIGTYWLEHIESTRWYRHCPAFLSLEDTYRLEPAANAQRDEARRQQGALADALFTFVRQDERVLQHETLRRHDVVVARHMMHVAFTIILPSFGNRVLAAGSPDPAERLRKVPRALTSGVSDDDLTLLCTHGPLHIPD